MQTAQIEKLHQSGLHNIMFRNAGVGLLFYEPPDGWEMETENVQIGDIAIPKPTDVWKKYLVVRKRC